jgi:hypothetical protein
MPSDPLNDKLLEIDSHLRDLTPEMRDKILDWIRTSKQKVTRIQTSVKALQDSLDTLRVIIKYTVFDLEATRRENQFLRDQLADAHDELSSHGHYAEDQSPPSGMMMLPEAEEGVIDLPEIGDYIHNNECNHPYDIDCHCPHCDEYRWRMNQQSEGSD